MKKTVYSKVTSETVCELRRIVGEKYVIYEEKEKLEPFSHDEIPDRSYAAMPEVVVRPRTAEEISAIMKLANSAKIPVTPRGAGSGLSGGAVPLYGGILLSVDRMNKILEIDRENMMITLEPGVIANDINDAVERYGLFYAGYPMSLETCFIGGNVAENAGGAKAVKYGVTSHYVLGLKVVMPTGEIVEMGGKLLKDVTGYNMLQLMVGSEGTLGIFTEIILKLIPRPSEEVDLLCLFDSPEKAVSALPEIMTNGIVPTSIEFMDRKSIEASCNYLNEKIPYEECGAMLLITLDGRSEKTLESEYESVGKICQNAGASEVYVADNTTTSERIWRIRRNISEAYSLMSKRQLNEDLVVPPASIPEMVAKFAELEKRYNLTIPCFGHAGDGNLHARIIPSSDISDSEWKKMTPEILNELYTMVRNAGGRISGEHGIGHKRKKYISKVLSEDYINLLKMIKQTLDPENILNPGKIFEIN